MTKRKNVKPKDTEVKCELCEKPLKDFELFTQIGNKEKICFRCELKFKQDEKNLSTK